MSASSAVESRGAGLGRRLRALPALLPVLGPAAISASVVSVVAADAGGYFPRTWRLTSFALLALAAAALLARERIALRRLEWWLLALLAAVAGWTALSAVWSTESSNSLLEGERVIVYLASAAVVVLVTERRSLAALLSGIVVGVTAASSVGLGFYLFGTRRLDPYQGTLLFKPLGYANALGIYAAMGILLSIGLAASARRRRARAAALAPLLVLAPTLYLTSSRGAWAALLVGFVALLALTGKARLGLARIVPLLAVAVVAAQLVGGGGLVPAGDNRPHYWAVAWRDYEANPLLGAGAGTFGNYWVAHRTIDSFAQDAHNLYLESLAELGPIGLILVAGALLVPFLALRRRQDPLVASAAAAYLAFVLHAGVDWDWEVPAVTLSGLFCGAAVLVGTRPASTRPLTWRSRGVLLGTVLALGIFTAERLATGDQSLFPPW